MDRADGEMIVMRIDFTDEVECPAAVIAIKIIAEDPIVSVDLEDLIVRISPMERNMDRRIAVAARSSVDVDRNMVEVTDSGKTFQPTSGLFRFPSRCVSRFVYYFNDSLKIPGVLYCVWTSLI
jgi:hypothetical protein